MSGPRPAPGTSGRPDHSGALSNPEACKGAEAASHTPFVPDKILEEALRHANELEAIFSAHADALILYAPDGEIRRINPAGRELFGFSGGEGPKEYRELMSSLAPIDADGAPIRFEDLPSRRALRGELVRGVVVGLQSARGRVWTSVSAAPLRGPDGAIAGAVVADVDITPLHRLQEEREQIVRALTHDARTRLNVIRTHGELLGRAPVSEEDARRRAALIVSSARQLADIIDALVDAK